MSKDNEKLSLNDETDYGLCFVCGPRNRCGLRLRFERVGDTVTTTFRARKAHQGFPGYVHGGVVSAILDEVMNRVTLLEGRWAMTARVDVRFRSPLRMDESAIAVGERIRSRSGFVETKGRVELRDGTVVAEATGTFAFIPDETLAGMSEGFPRLAAEWMR